MPDKLRASAYFFLQRLVGSQVSVYYHELLHLERLPALKVVELQARRLEEVLRSAAANIPFYRERCNGRMELSEFPVVRKDDLREQFQQFMIPSLRAVYRESGARAGYDWLEVRTGGSTGIPTRVIHDREFRDRGRATRLYSQYLCGFPFGTPYLRLWGSMEDLRSSTRSLAPRVQSLLAGETLMNAFRMSDDDMMRHFGVIKRSEAEFLMAYVDAAVALARFSIRKGLKARKLTSIMACAGTVTDDAVKLLQTVFEARIHNKYGSRDCADIACQCEAGGMHVYSPNVFLEMIDSGGKQVKNGESGKILITLLGNRSFPLIRYEIGDIGAMSSDRCTCGSSFPLIKHIEGRTVEVLTTTQGGYVSPVYIRHLVGVVHEAPFIRRYQLVQHSACEYELRVELENGVAGETTREKLEAIVRDLRLVFGSDALFSMTRMKEIPPTPSGKYLYTLNLCTDRNADTGSS